MTANGSSASARTAAASRSPSAPNTALNGTIRFVSWCTERP